MLYFDNHPHYHYGTIRQQFWSALHFPFHLAIVGVVEGSQQIALARYVFKSTAKLMGDIELYCTRQQLEGNDPPSRVLRSATNREIPQALTSSTPSTKASTTSSWTRKLNPSSNGT